MGLSLLWLLLLLLSLLLLLLLLLLLFLLLLLLLLLLLFLLLLLSVLLLLLLLLCLHLFLLLLWLRCWRLGLGDVGVEVHLLPGGVLPVVGPAFVLHPVDQTHQVLAVGLQVVSQGAGELLVNHDQLGHVAEHHHDQHGGLVPEEELLLAPM